MVLLGLVFEILFGWLRFLGGDQQKKAERYFKDRGIWGKILGLKDDAYDQMVLDRLNSLDLRRKAIAKTGLDEDQLKEIAPVFIHGYNFHDVSPDYTCVGTDSRLRSAMYDAAWLLFSDTHVYMYTYTFDMTSASKKTEKTEEFFYKDITSFSTTNETAEFVKLGWAGQKTKEKYTREYSRFALAVAGDKFYCSTTGAPDAERSISAMKQKLREKKQS